MDLVYTDHAGVEFLSIDEFSETVARFGGTHNIPKWIEDLDGFLENISKIPERIEGTRFVPA